MSIIVKISLIFFVSLVVTGLFMTLVPAISFPEVSGDMVWRVSGDVRIYVPLGTAMMVTGGITFFLWASGKL